MFELLLIGAIFFAVNYGLFRLFESRKGFWKFIVGFLVFLFSLSIIQQGNSILNTIWLAALLLAYREKLINFGWRLADYFRGSFYFLFNVYNSAAGMFLSQKEKESQEQAEYRYQRAYNDTSTAELHKAQEEARQAKAEAHRAREDARRAREQAQRAEQKQKSSPTSDSRTAYEILGVSSSATPAEIKKAYRECCQRYHPDKYATRPAHIQKTMEEELKKVNIAFDSIL